MGKGKEGERRYIKVGAEFFTTSLCIIKKMKGHLGFSLKVCETQMSTILEESGFDLGSRCLLLLPAAEMIKRMQTGNTNRM